MFKALFGVIGAVIGILVSFYVVCSLIKAGLKAHKDKIMKKIDP